MTHPHVTDASGTTSSTSGPSRCGCWPSPSRQAAPSPWASSRAGRGHGPCRMFTSTPEESFYVLDGAFTFTLGTEDVEAGPGSFVRVPPGTRHELRAGSGGGRVRLCVPGDRGHVRGAEPDAPWQPPRPRSPRQSPAGLAEFHPSLELAAARWPVRPRPPNTIAVLPASRRPARPAVGTLQARGPTRVNGGPRLLRSDASGSEHPRHGAGVAKDPLLLGGRTATPTGEVGSGVCRPRAGGRSSRARAVHRELGKHPRTAPMDCSYSSAAVATDCCCPLVTAADRCVGHVEGTAGEDEPRFSRGPMVTRSTEGEARPRRTASPRWQASRARGRPGPVRSGIHVGEDAA